MTIRTTRRRPGGAIVPLIAILAAFLCGVIAFGVDLGYIVHVRQELQNAADSAALAGASQLIGPNLYRSVPNQDQAMADARAEAKRFALANTAGTRSLDLMDNPNNDAAGDIVCGAYANPKDRHEAMAFNRFPNAVAVRTRRDAQKNSPLSLYFARIFNMNQIALQAAATAVYEDRITGFQFQNNTPGMECKLLPYALKVDTWQALLAGSGTDSFSRNHSTGVVTPGFDHVLECKLFPLSSGASGNWGTVDFGGAGNSASDLARQILHGPNADDLAHFPNGRMELNPDTGVLHLNGDTGITAGVKNELRSIIGQPRIIPLFSQVSGSGNNADYTIVGFAGITIVDVQLTGSLQIKHLTIQPCSVVDGTAVSSTTTTGSSWYVFRPLALCR